MSAPIDKMRKLWKQHSLGKDRMLLCSLCMMEVEVFSAAGHKPGEMNLHCINCGQFVARLIKDFQGQWTLDLTVYGNKSNTF